jgi:hypothetical protein
MAIQVVAGEPLQTYITYAYPDDTPILNATFSVESALRSDGTSFAGTVIVSESANGVYTVTAPTEITDPPGTWHLVVRSNLDDALFSEKFDITSTRAPVVVIQNIYRSGITRRDLRRMVARELGDLVDVRATLQGTESSIVDTINLTLENRHYNGMDIRCVSAAASQNVGRFATVTASSQDHSSVNFVPPFPLPTMPGDEFELTNFRGTGWRGVEYDNAINAAILRAGDEHYTIPYSTTLTDRFSRNAPTLTIPDEFAYFAGVAYTDRRGERKTLPPSSYDVDRYSNEVTIRTSFRGKMQGASVTLRGRTEPPLLEADEHATPIPVDWILTEVKAILQNKVVSQGAGQDRSRLFYMDRQGADSRRTLIIPSHAPNTIKLRGGRTTYSSATYGTAVYAPEDEG